MHEWMSDNAQTPLLLVDADHADVMVPEGFVEDGHIVLNSSWSATRNLQLGNDLITFEARFSGVSHVVSVPVAAVKGVYARESGQGMMFQEDAPSTESSSAGSALQEDASAENAAAKDSQTDKKPGRPGLRLVK